MPRPTIYAVADRAGVSIATVSRVLNNSASVKPATRAKVQQAMLEMGYNPSATARGLATQHTQTLALIVPGIRDALVFDCLRGVQSAAHQQNYHVLVIELHVSDAGESPLFLPAKVDGYVISPGCVSGDILTTLKDQQIPAVLLYNASIEPGDSVIIDSEQGAYTAVSHAIGHGKRRIACISDANVKTSLRVKGYARALTSHGLSVNPHLLVEGGYTAIAGYKAMQRLLDLAIPPQAVFIADDQAAAGALAAIRERGKRVPEDIAVIGYGDQSLASFTSPPLTTVQHIAYEQGFLAGKLLIQRIADPQRAPERHPLTSSMQIRQSCGCKTE